MKNSAKNQRYLLLTLMLFMSYGGAFAQWCIPTYGTTCVGPGVNDFVNTVETTGGLTDISNVGSGCCLLPDNYIFNAGMPLISEPGATIDVHLESGAIYSQGFSVWIDWNNDFTFDAAEKIFSSPMPGAAPSMFDFSFTVPSGIDCGTYRMRVRCEYFQSGATINPCDYNFYGECEDYPVIIDNCEPTICRGDSTTLDFTASDPGPGSTYSWSPATDISDPFGGPLVDVWPTDTTTYTVTITDPTGATFTLDFPVNVNVPPNPDAGLDDTLCHDVLAGYPLVGTIENPDSDVLWDMVDYTGPFAGTPTFIYSGGADILTPTGTVSEPGSYTHVLYATDPLGICPDESDTVMILYSLEEHTTTFTDPLCFGSADGTITVTSTGTVGADQYSIDGGVTWQASNLFTGLTSGTYTVVSMDPVGCTFESTVDLTDPTEIVITTSPDTTVCENGSATVYASATGGTTYDFHWDFTPDLGSSQTLPIFADPTLVTVYAESELGCVSTTETITISMHPPITLTISANDTVCPGFASGAEVFPTGGFMGYTYSWTEYSNPMTETGSSVSTNPDVETVYCVTVADGCETTPVTICTRTAMREVPSPTFTSDTTEGCNPSTITFTNLTPSHLLGTVVWTINGAELTGVNTFDYEFSEVGSYDIGLEVTSPYGCYGSIMASEYITIHDNPDAIFYVLPNPTTIFNTEVTMSNLTDGPDNDYQWFFPGGSPANSTETNPTVLYPEGVAGVYPVHLLVTDEHNCTDSITANVNIMSDVLIYAPNTFTPDGDALNQTWRVYMDGIDIYDFHLMMFDRWGNPVWESFNSIAEWNGTYGNQGLVPDGVYVWVVTAKDANSDKLYEFRGHVTVLK